MTRSVARPNGFTQSGPAGSGTGVARHGLDEGAIGLDGAGRPWRGGPRERAARRRGDEQTDRPHHRGDVDRATRHRGGTPRTTPQRTRSGGEAVSREPRDPRGGGRDRSLALTGSHTCHRGACRSSGRGMSLYIGRPAAAHPRRGGNASRVRSLVPSRDDSCSDASVHDPSAGMHLYLSDQGSLPIASGTESRRHR